MKKNIQNIFLILSLLFASSFAYSSQISIADRHMLMIQPGLEKVVGSYMFGVKNNTSEPKEFSFELLLPKETLDFGPQDGLNKEDLALSENGKVVVKKIFPVGLSILSVGFLAEVGSEEGVLNFQVPYSLKELSFITNSESLKFDSKGLIEGVPLMLKGNSFKGIISENEIKANSHIVLSLSGLAKGRSDFITLGIVFSVLVLVLVAVFSFKTRPSKNSDEVLNEVMEL
jgi:hypothetical protein